LNCKAVGLIFLILGLLAIPGMGDDPAWVYHAKGNYYRSRREYGRALTMYNRALDIDPNFIRARLALIDYYLNDYRSGNPGRERYYKVRGHLEELLSYKRKNSKEDNAYAFYLYLAGKNEFFLGNTKKAHGYCDHAIRIKQEFRRPWYFKAYIYREEKRYGKAVEIYLRLIATDDFKAHPDPDAFRRIGGCYRAMGEIGKAIKSYREALRLAPRDKEVIGTLFDYRRRLQERNRPEGEETEVIIDVAESLLQSEAGGGRNVADIRHLLTVLERFAVRRKENRRRISNVRNRLGRLSRRGRTDK